MYVSHSTLRRGAAAASLAFIASTAMPATASPAGPALRVAQRASTFASPGPRRLIYVANALSNSVTIYPDAVNNPLPIGVITSGISDPQGITVDYSGNIYVANAGTNTVDVYEPGQSVPTLIYANGISSPSDVAVDRNGTVYVANQKPASIVEFARGSTQPTAVISDVAGPTALALDRYGNLFVSDVNPIGGQSRVLAYGPGSLQGKDLGIAVKYASGLAFDPKSGNLFVADRDAGAVYRYQPQFGMKQGGRDPGVVIVIYVDDPLHIIWINTTLTLLVSEFQDDVLTAFAHGQGKQTGFISQKVDGPVAATESVRLF